MSGIDVAKVVISRAGKDAEQWRARSYGANGEQIAMTETYHNYSEAEDAAYTISAGAEVVRQDDPADPKETDDEG